MAKHDIAVAAQWQARGRRAASSRNRRDFYRSGESKIVSPTVLYDVARGVKDRCPMSMITYLLGNMNSLLSTSTEIKS